MADRVRAPRCSTLIKHHSSLPQRALRTASRVPPRSSRVYGCTRTRAVLDVLGVLVNTTLRLEQLRGWPGEWRTWRASGHRIGASAAQPSTGGRCLRGDRGVVSPGLQEMVFHRAPPGGAGHPAARASVAGARLGTRRPTTEEVLLDRGSVGGWWVGDPASLALFSDSRALPRILITPGRAVVVGCGAIYLGGLFEAAEDPRDRSCWRPESRLDDARVHRPCPQRILWSPGVAKRRRLPPHRWCRKVPGRRWGLPRGRKVGGSLGDSQGRWEGGRPCVLMHPVVLCRMRHRQRRRQPTAVSGAAVLPPDSCLQKRCLGSWHASHIVGWRGGVVSGHTFCNATAGRVAHVPPSISHFPLPSHRQASR